ncbi:MAG: hypothetical protein IJC34_07870 [Lentisphaeria bacterium]|nr:hypothetical protein [Lentisphaeria bacterium]
MPPFIWNGKTTKRTTCFPASAGIIHCLAYAIVFPFIPRYRHLDQSGIPLAKAGMTMEASPGLLWTVLSMPALIAGPGFLQMGKYINSKERSA